MSSLRRTLAGWPPPLQWSVLLLLSLLVSLLWGAMRLPAALLLGPMLGGVVFGVNGVRLSVPRWPYIGAQGIIGAMVTMAITPAIVTTLGAHVLLFAVVMAATLVGAAAIGWLISRTGLIPGGTAVYGTSPGAASAMVLLGEAEGADTQLVAFMQYSRVLLVALAAALVAHFWAGNVTAHPPAAAAWSAPVHWGTSRWSCC